MTLKLNKPPMQESPRRATLLDVHWARIVALSAKHPGLSTEHIDDELACSLEGCSGSASSLAAISAQSVIDSSIYQEVG
jgi:hypothetical protein